MFLLGTLSHPKGPARRVLYLNYVHSERYFSTDTTASVSRQGKPSELCVCDQLRFRLCGPLRVNVRETPTPQTRTKLCVREPTQVRPNQADAEAGPGPRGWTVREGAPSPRCTRCASPSPKASVCPSPTQGVVCEGEPTRGKQREHGKDSEERTLPEPSPGSTQKRRRADGCRRAPLRRPGGSEDVRPMCLHLVDTFRSVPSGLLFGFTQAGYPDQSHATKPLVDTSHLRLPLAEYHDER